MSAIGFIVDASGRVEWLPLTGFLFVYAAALGSSRSVSHVALPSGSSD